jgi:hypothetical protein
MAQVAVLNGGVSSGRQPAVLATIETQQISIH